MLRHPQVSVPLGGMLRAMKAVPVPPLGQSLQVVGALLTLAALVTLVGLAVSAMIVGPLMLVAGTFVESPALLGRLLARRARPTGGG